MDLLNDDIHYVAYYGNKYFYYNFYGLMKHETVYDNTIINNDNLVNLKERGIIAHSYGIYTNVKYDVYYIDEDYIIVRRSNDENNYPNYDTINNHRIDYIEVNINNIKDII